MGINSIKIPSVYIRRASAGDAGNITSLFYDTITTINKKDYNEEQIATWSAGAKNTASWLTKIKEQYFFIAENNEQLLGFASITGEGYIDLLYTHKDYQGMGLGYLLLNTLEQQAKELGLQLIWSDVSLTARPFFLKKGFSISKVYAKQVSGIDFENTIMTKALLISR